MEHGTRADLNVDPDVLDVYFLLRLPYLLPAPLGEPGVPIDTGHWDTERDLMEANQDEGSSTAVDLSLPHTAIQFACSTVPKNLEYPDLAESWSHLPDVWPWVSRNGSPDQPSNLGVEWVSLLSVRVTPRGGVQRFESDRDALLSDCFQVTVHGVLDFLEVLALAAAEPFPSLNVADLEPIIPFAVRYRGSRKSDPLPVGPFLNPSSLAMHRFQEPQPLSKERLDAALGAAAHETPYLSANAMHKQAMWAYKAGDYWSAVLKSAVYSEMVIHLTARLLAWESGMTPEQGREQLGGDVNSSLAAFAATHVGGRLGGNWDAQRKGPVQSWHRAVATVRNRLLHAGERASAGEAIAAVEAAGGLLDYIKELLLGDKNLPKYAITAASLWGQPRLVDKRRWTRRVREKVERAGTGVFLRFHRWSRSLDAPAIRAEPDKKEVLLTAVYEVGPQEVRWVVRLLTTPWAAEARVEEEMTPRIRELVRDVQVPGAETPPHLVFSLPGVRAWERTGDWVLGHHLLPDADIAP